MDTRIKAYLRELHKAHAAGNATEHTYRPALKTLVESFGKHIAATNEPKRVRCGAPDFIVARGEAPVGSIECKDIDTPLGKIEKSEQLQRYLGSLHNLILTDYLEFRYYVDGEQVMHVTLARIDAKDKIKPMQGADEQLADLLQTFLSAEPSTIHSPKVLAARLADIAKVIRDAIEKAFTLEDEAGTLHGEYESFKATILPQMTPEEFADMYAQTVCYGLFAARTNVPDQHAHEFTREHAAYDLPRTNPFLREVFDYIAGTRLDPTITWAVDLLVETLRRCVNDDILKDFGRATRQEDPVVHFYETFLAEYDPALRQSRGVYYTPEPVVNFIVRSIDEILKTEFDCAQGLADTSKVSAEFSDTTTKSGKTRRDVHRVQILDPATGTGTFLYETIQHIRDSLGATAGSWGGPEGYVARHLLPRLFGFELMMAPYSIAHLKLGLLLKDSGYDFASDQRLRVYLTNTLEESEVVAGPLLALANQIAREANAAGKVKTECPIMVVMGNPPYSGHSANNNAWSRDLIHKKLATGGTSYFECDGKPLGERNPKWLNDDYVKFIRFAQYRIELTGYGVLGFISNNGYLDNPTFRGMRQSLMQTFDEIRIVDLHGSTKKKETAPDGSKDENVFDIQQGVSIGVFIRKTGRHKRSAKVFHTDVYGTRDRKYDWLNQASCQGEPIEPQAPFYLFVPQDTERLDEYQQGRLLTDIFPKNGVGMTTARDHVVIDMEPEPILDRARFFRDSTASDEEVCRELRIPMKKGWDIPGSRTLIQEENDLSKFLRPVLYRPFDERIIFYHDSLVWRTVKKVMHHMLAGENLGLITTRQTRDKWDVHVSRNICGHKTCSAYDINTLFPLYLYPTGEGLFEDRPWPAGRDGRRPNLDPVFVEEFAGRLGLEFVSDGTGDLESTFGPEDIFHYAYAVFHCPTYRERYAEFLKIDFPRLPLTGDRDLFVRLCGLGGELVGLHLLEAVPEPTATYPQAGENVITRKGTKASPMYAPPTDEHPGRVYVNDEQYFENVLPEVWEFHVGGYQVCRKWLKDRHGRTLSHDDVEHYRKTTEALRRTIRLMGEIDEAIPSWPIK